MNRAGDWKCRSCQHLNFQRRESCQRCGDARGGAADYGSFGGRSGGSSSLGFSTGPDVRPGDWYCAVANCGTHNFANRSTCFRCAAFKDDASAARPLSFGAAATATRSAWKSGDWICTRSGCNEHNFASRMECFRCNAPRDSATNSPY